MTLPSTIRLRPATKADVPSIASIGLAAFGSNRTHSVLWPAKLRILPGDGDQLAWRIARLESAMDSPQAGSYCIVAVVDDASSGKEAVVGCAEWVSPPAPKVEAPDGSTELKLEKTAAERETGSEERKKSWPAAMDKDAMMAYIDGETELIGALGNTLGDGFIQKIWCMLFSASNLIFQGLSIHVSYMDFVAYAPFYLDPSTVVVDPGYQRKGIGKMLMQWGLDRAEKDGQDVCLSSSTAGLSLYLKLGFVALASKDILGDEWTAMVKKFGP